jgi:hypothetical protein
LLLQRQVLRRELHQGLAQLRILAPRRESRVIVIGDQ